MLIFILDTEMETAAAAAAADDDVMKVQHIHSCSGSLWPCGAPVSPLKSSMWAILKKKNNVSCFLTRRAAL